MTPPINRDDEDPGDVTRLLDLAHGGDAAAMNELLPIVYQELKRIAASQRRKQVKPSHMLNTTAVVNEAWMRLYEHDQGYQNRQHFMAVAATAMRQLLIDEARKQMRQKRGGGAVQITENPDIPVADEAAWLLTLDKALDQLGEHQPRLRDVFELRYFAGLTEKEIADVLQVSERTVRRDWIKAKAMLSVIL